jgi:hypothetical protein
MTAYMQFKFVQQTNSDDEVYETDRTEGLVKRILGSPKVTSFELIQEMPEGWIPGDPIPGE